VAIPVYVLRFLRLQANSGFRFEIKVFKWLVNEVIKKMKNFLASANVYYSVSKVVAANIN
jgi:hypothetical protein